jgi:carbon storage regulator
MLVLSRKPGQKLQIGDNITVTVLEVHGHVLRLGIEAPQDVRVLRGELQDWLRPEVAPIARRREPAVAG